MPKMVLSTARLRGARRRPGDTHGDLGAQSLRPGHDAPARLRQVRRLLSSRGTWRIRCIRPSATGARRLGQRKQDSHGRSVLYRAPYSDAADRVSRCSFADGVFCARPQTLYGQCPQLVMGV